MTIQLSDCCKAPIDFYPKLERPDCYKCSFCDRVIGSPLNHNKPIRETVEELEQSLEVLFNEAVACIFKQIKGQITEGERKDYLNKLNQDGINKIRKAFTTQQTAHEELAMAREKQLKDIHTMELDAISCKSIEDFVIWRDERKQRPLSNKDVT